MLFAFASGLVFIVALLFAMKRRARAIALAVAAAAIGFSLGCAHAAQIVKVGDALVGYAGSAEITLLEDSSNKGFGENAFVSVRLENGVTGVFSARFDDAEPLFAGEHYGGGALFVAADYEKNPFAWTNGSCGTVKINAIEKRLEPFPLDILLDVRKRAIYAIGDEDDGHRLLQALVCGYRRGVDGTEMFSQFQTCGLAHLVAVSGAHLVIVTGLFALLLRQMNAPRRLSIVVLIASMLAYYVFAGMPTSALRATLMSALGLLSYFGRRRPSSLNAVGVAVFALIAANPASSVSASFVLSALSTVGIVLFSPLFQAWLERTALVRFPFIVEGLSLTFSAALLSQLYACSLFSQLPLIAPFANVLTAPIFPIACGAGLMFAMAASAPGASVILGGAASMVSQGLSGLVALLARVPYASVPFSIESATALVVSAVASMALWALWPKDVRKVGACCIIVLSALIGFALVVVDRSDSIVALDVGQGDAILVRSRGSSLLIDTGNRDSQLLGELGRNHVTHLDAVLLSHSDDDHCGSLDALRGAVRVDRAIVASQMITCEKDAPKSLVKEAESTAREVIGVQQGDEIRIGAISARVVWPHAFTEDGGNADSLCVLLEYDGDDDGSVDCRAFMTGDAEKEEIAQMLDAGLVGDIDILKVGHHGSRNGTTLDEMRALRPEIALISCGEHNRYGHPTQEILDQLDAVGAATFRTDRDGEIRCTLTPERISVERLE